MPTTHAAETAAERPTLYDAAAPAHARYRAAMERCERGECGRTVDSAFCRRPACRRAERELSREIHALVAQGLS